MIIGEIRRDESYVWKKHAIYGKSLWLRCSVEWMESISSVVCQN